MAKLTAAVEPEPVPENEPPKETRALKKERVESFRRFARERTLEEISALADEIFEHGTRSEKFAFLSFLSASGFGTAPKAPEIREEGRSMTDMLQEIARARTLEEGRKALPAAPDPTPSESGNSPL